MGFRYFNKIMKLKSIALTLLFLKRLYTARFGFRTELIIKLAGKFLAILYRFQDRYLL
jgi:hypothetical protein